MAFKDKYTTISRKEQDKDKEKNKKEISEEAYAIGDIIQDLINKLEQTRINLIR